MYLDYAPAHSFVEDLVVVVVVMVVIVVMIVSLRVARMVMMLAVVIVMMAVTSSERCDHADAGQQYQAARSRQNCQSSPDHVLVSLKQIPLSCSTRRRQNRSPTAGSFHDRPYRKEIVSILK